MMELKYYYDKKLLDKCYYDYIKGKTDKDIKIFTKDIELTALEQIDLLMNQEAFKDRKIRIMPDVHAGAGCVIGFTGNLGNKVIPNIVGVDIGCGMLCVMLGKNELNLEKLDKVIKQFVPSGFEVHKERKVKFDLLHDLKCFRELKDTKRIERSIGSLGGGNHFIEVDVDDTNGKYLIIHTGSRNLGKQVAEYYQEMANQLCNYNLLEYKENKEKLIAEYKNQGKKQDIQGALRELKQNYNINKNQIPKDLAYLEGQYMDDYLHDMRICQEFAAVNRRTIAREILSHYFEINGGTVQSIFDYFETIHNYISFEDSIVRKGAISARNGEKVLIPLNMRDGCIIGIGKGNEDWNCSAPHGAGRTMSRAVAKTNITLEQFEQSMKGIYSTTVCNETIDESAFAYKPSEEIIKNIQETVDIVKVIKPIYNFKATDNRTGG